MFIENQNLQVEVERLRKEVQVKEKILLLGEEKTAALNGQIKKLLEELAQSNEKLRKSKEETLKVTKQRKDTESFLIEQEQENMVLKGKEKSIFEEAIRETETLRSEIKGLKARRNELESKITRLDSENHTLKLELEKTKMENMDLKMGNRALETQVSMIKETRPPMEPVMMRSEQRPPSADPRSLVKKTCINELVQMVKNFKADAIGSRIK